MEQALKALAESSIDGSSNTFVKRLIEIAYLEGQLEGARVARTIISEELGVSI